MYEHNGEMIISRYADVWYDCRIMKGVQEMIVSRYAGYGTHSINNNSYNDTDIDSVSGAGVKQTDRQLAANATESKHTSSNKAPKHSAPADFTFDFKKDNRFNLEGATKDYEDINISKALSDMKKDTILDKYKFFVDSPNLGTDGDGTVRIVRK